MRNKEYEWIRDETRRRNKGIKSHTEKKMEKVALIGNVLNYTPDASVRSIEEKTNLPKSTVSRLIKEFGLK